MIAAQPKPGRVERGQVWAYCSSIKAMLYVVHGTETTSEGVDVASLGSEEALVGDMLCGPRWHYLGTLDCALMPEE